MITSGPKQNEVNGNWGSQGVGIILNKDGVVAWKAAGSQSHVDLGARVMALLLLFKDSQHREVRIILILGYAHVGKTPENEWEDYFDKLATCFWRKQNYVIIVIGTDCNSSMGCKSGREIDSRLGCFGLNHTNQSGLHFLTYLAINNLKVATASFLRHGFIQETTSNWPFYSKLQNVSWCYRCRIDTSTSLCYLHETPHNETIEKEHRNLFMYAWSRLFNNK